jgi:uncharacterized protein (DUF983 family)
MLQAPPLLALLGRVARLACPACGRGRLFRRYFLRAERCAACRWRFERGEGHWVGGSEVHMFVSYGLSVLACVPFLMILDPTPFLYGAVLGGHVLVSLVVFRYSRAIFLALDLYLDPEAPAAGGDDRDGLGEPVRPRPGPGTRRRAGGRLRGARMRRRHTRESRGGAAPRNRIGRGFARSREAPAAALRLRGGFGPLRTGRRPA